MNASFARLAKSAARGSVRPRLLRLVIVIAAVLIVSILPATARANNSERPTIVLVHGAWASAPGWDMVVAGLQKDGFTTANPTLEATLNAEQIPLNFSIALTPSGPVAWHTLPSWYAVSGKDLMVDPAEELFMAQRAGATTVVFPAASHAGGITHYATGFVKLIEEAVQETAD